MGSDIIEAVIGINLGKGLRLKRNLSLFVSEIARETGSAWEVEPSPSAGGGRVIVLCKPYTTERDFHESLIADLKFDGNDCVDMLLCVPPDGVAESEGRRASRISQKIGTWGQAYWDGVDPIARSDFPRSTAQVRTATSTIVAFIVQRLVSHGSITSSPIASKGRRSRVATLHRS